MCCSLLQIETSTALYNNAAKGNNRHIQIDENMDALDEILKELSQELEQAQKSNKLTPKSTLAFDISKDDCFADDLSDKCKTIINSIHNIINDLADSAILENTNKKLSKYRFTEFVQYYLKNVKLGNYSIERELQRMDFEVTHNTNITTDKFLIAAIYEKTALNDIWRFANQSLYADIITSINDSYSTNRAIPCALIAKSSKMVINIDTTHISGTSVFSFFIPTANRRRGNKLELASIAGTVELSLKDRCLRMSISPPTMYIVFDSDFRYDTI